jgi:hypothetical protein
MDMARINDLEVASTQLPTSSSTPATPGLHLGRVIERQSVTEFRQILYGQRLSPDSPPPDFGKERVGPQLNTLKIRVSDSCLTPRLI